MSLAKDLPHNPVPCGISPHPHSVAVKVLEAVVPDTISVEPLRWLLCASVECRMEAYRQADSYLPTSTDLRDATVRELSAISGLAVVETAVV